mmetsp:Transcript_27918/g.90092  ORF Transcript_27918/g.90092 Transcript_27918/m.90092 type:complete len:216 (+) Transcript_27918:349-996(+)
MRGDPDADMEAFATLALAPEGRGPGGEGFDSCSMLTRAESSPRPQSSRPRPCSSCAFAHDGDPGKRDGEPVCMWPTACMPRRARVNAGGEGDDDMDDDADGAAAAPPRADEPTRDAATLSPGPTPIRDTTLTNSPPRSDPRSPPAPDPEFDPADGDIDGSRMRSGAGRWTLDPPTECSLSLPSLPAPHAYNSAAPSERSHPGVSRPPTDSVSNPR